MARLQILESRTTLFSSAWCVVGAKSSGFATLDKDSWIQQQALDVGVRVSLLLRLAWLGLTDPRFVWLWPVHFRKGV